MAVAELEVDFHMDLKDTGQVFVEQVPRVIQKGLKVLGTGLVRGQGAGISTNEPKLPILGTAFRYM